MKSYTVVVSCKYLRCSDMENLSDSNINIKPALINYDNILHVDFSLVFFNNFFTSHIITYNI